MRYVFFRAGFTTKSHPNIGLFKLEDSVSQFVPGIAILPFLRWNKPVRKKVKKGLRAGEMRLGLLTGESEGRPSSASRLNKSTLLSAFQASNFSQLIHLCFCSTVGLANAPIHSKVDTTRSPRHMALSRRFSKQCSTRQKNQPSFRWCYWLQITYRYGLSALEAHLLQGMANSALCASIFGPSAGRYSLASFNWRMNSKLTTQWTSW